MSNRIRMLVVPHEDVTDAKSHVIMVYRGVYHCEQPTWFWRQDPQSHRTASSWWWPPRKWCPSWTRHISHCSCCLQTKIIHFLAKKYLPQELKPPEKWCFKSLHSGIFHLISCLIASYFSYLNDTVCNYKVNSISLLFFFLMNCFSQSFSYCKMFLCKLIKYASVQNITDFLWFFGKFASCIPPPQIYI